MGSGRDSLAEGSSGRECLKVIQVEREYMDRRQLLKVVGLGTAALPFSSVNAQETSAVTTEVKASTLPQTVMGWCYKELDLEVFADACVATGIVGIEGVAIKDYEFLKSKGLKISMVRTTRFDDGPTNKAEHPRLKKVVMEAIDLAVQHECPNVILFSGMKVEGLSHTQMTENCVQFWKSVAPYAEKKGVTLVLEHLNSRDDSHPMKGHPGYFADDIDHSAEMVRAVDSPAMKLLFDIYHVSVMNGDIIRRIHQHKDVIGHVHTAGNPGRGPLDMSQEINYPPIIQALKDIGYTGYVGHEFLCPKEDIIESLKDAYRQCC